MIFLIDIFHVMLHYDNLLKYYFGVIGPTFQVYFMYTIMHIIDFTANGNNEKYLKDNK